MWVDQLERRSLFNFLASVVARSQGAEMETIDPGVEREEFETWLRKPPPGTEERSPEQKTLIAALFPKDGPVTI